MDIKDECRGRGGECQNSASGQCNTADRTSEDRSTQDTVHPMDVLENFELEEVTVHRSTSELLLLLQADSFSTLPRTQ